MLALEEDSALQAACSSTMPAQMPEAPEKTSLDDIDDMVHSAAALEQLHQNLGAIAAHQPLKQSVAAALEAAVDQLRRSSGLDSRPTFVVESFYGKAARAHGTKVAMESIAETIKALVQKILAWIAQVPGRVIASLTDAYKGANAFTDRAQSLQSKAVDVKARFGQQRLDVKLQDAAWINFLAGHDSAASVIRSFETTYKTFNTHFSSQILGAVAQHVNLIASDLLKADTGAEFTNEAAAKEVHKAIMWLQQHAFAPFHKESHGGAILKLPFGGDALAISYVKHGAYTVGVSVHMEPGKPEAGAQLPCLSPDEIVQLSHAMVNQLGTGLYHDYVKIKNELTGMASVLKQTCEAIAKRQAQNGAGAVASLHFLKMLVDSQLKLAHYAYSYSAKVNAAIISYCEGSLRVYHETAKNSPHENAPALQVTDVAANDPKVKAPRAKK